MNVRDKIMNEYIWKIVGVAVIEEKMMKFI